VPYNCREEKDVTEFDKLDQELTKLNFKGISRGKTLAHLVHKISVMLASNTVLVEEDETGAVLGIYIGNHHTARAFKQLLGRIHYTVKKGEE